MVVLRCLALGCILLAVCGPAIVTSHALIISKEKPDSVLRIEPTEGIFHAGDNVTFICSYPSNVTFQWHLGTKMRPFKIVTGVALSNATYNPVFFSKMTVLFVKRSMTGEIICSAGNQEASGFLIVNGVKNGGSCRSSTDCITDRSICIEGICSCPRNNVLLKLGESGFEVCREMIYSLYDPCDFDEQCKYLVDPKSVCGSNAVCMCETWAIEIKGKCESKSDISYNKSQEMYRVGLIAVTCIIILIVAVSLWMTLKRSCHDQVADSERMNEDNSPPEIIEIANDKPPSYDDVLITEDVVTSPPNIKEALRHCMTAKRLLRQVSAPAGQLLPQNMSPNAFTDAKSNSSNKALGEH